MLNELEENIIAQFKPKTIHHHFGLEKTALDLCASIVMRYFSQGGVRLEPQLSIDSLMEQLNIIAPYRKMAALFLKICKQRQTSDPLSPEQLLGKVRDLYPKFFPFFSFLERTSRLYPEVLSGKIPHTQALFPAEDPLILKKVYEMTPKLGMEETYLHLVKEWLLDKLPSQGRIIEIGGGQGILTEILYPALGHLQGEYVFTDIGTSFLKEASQRWKSIKSQQYDVSRDPRAQNLKTSSFDALVGFNVIHATQNIGSSLRFCSSLVKPGGWILLVENAQQQIWIDLIYGLTPEWWNYEDGIRSLSPLLTCDEWEKLLADCRFSRSWVFPASGPRREKSDTALIAIQKEADDE